MNLLNIFKLFTYCPETNLSIITSFKIQAKKIKNKKTFNYFSTNFHNIYEDKYMHKKPQMSNTKSIFVAKLCLPKILASKVGWLNVV